MPDITTQLEAPTSHEVQELQRRLDELEESFFKVTFVPPIKPRETMIRFADGTSWNPGAGRGLYQYVSGAWTKL